MKNYFKILTAVLAVMAVFLMPEIGWGQTKATEVLLSEDFSAITTGNSTSTSGSNTAWNGNTNFPNVTKAYQAGGAIKIGSGSATGSITSKSLTVSAGTLTVAFDVKGWSSVEGNIKVTVGSQNQTVTYTATINGSFESKSIDFTIATAGSMTVKLETTAKRAFLDNIVVTNITGSSLTASDLAIAGSPVTLNFDLYNNASAQTVSYTTSSTGNVTVSGGNGYVTTSVNSGTKTITVTPSAVTSSAQTITVSQAADATYAAGSATFTVNVTNSEPFCGETFVAGTDVGSTTGNNSADEVSKGYVTIYCDDAAFKTEQYRFYKSSTATISTSVGKIIKIEFTSTAQGTSQYGPGLLSLESGSSGSYTCSGYVGTWVGSATSVSFNADAGQSRATQIVVTLDETVATPTFTPVSGNSTNTVSINCATTGADIYYTTDGTDPDKNSTPYTGAISVTGNVTIKAIAYNGGCNSEVATASFTSTCTPPANVLNYTTPVNIDWSGSAVNTTLSPTSGTGNGNAITYELSSGPSGGSVDGSTGVFSTNVPGIYVVTATQAADGTTCGGTFDITINVNDIRPACTISPTTYNFGLQMINTTQTADFTVSTANLTGDLSVSINNTDKGFSVSPTTIPQGSSNTTVTVTFAPTASTDGEVTATLSISGGGLSEPTTATIKGEGYTGYTVIYDCNGGTSGCPSNISGITNGTVISLPSAPTKTDYNFQGWDDGFEIYNAGQSYTVTSDVTFTARWVLSGGESGSICFGTLAGNEINSANCSFEDDLGNTWTVTTEGTTSFTQNDGWSQIGSSSYPASTITFTTTLSSAMPITSFIASFGGNSGSAATITLKVDDIVVGTRTLSNSVDVTAVNTTTATGQELTVTLTGISKGIKCYCISYTYVSTMTATPVFTPAGGTYAEAQEVSLSCATDGATIYYTTNGDTPTTSSSVYSAPISVTENTTIKAYAVKDGLEDSDVVQATYSIINPICTAGDYVKVTSANVPTDWAGIYLIVNETNNVAFNGTLENKWGRCSSVTISSENIIESDATVDAYAVTLIPSGTGYAVKVGNNQYMTWNTASVFALGDSPVAYQISIDDNGDAKIQYVTPTETLELFYNNSGSGGLRPYAYTAGQGAIQLYKKVGEEVEVTAVAETPGITEVWINSETHGTEVSHTEPVCNDVIFHATVAQGYHFDGWYDEDDNLVSANINYTFTVMEAVTYTAKASEKPLLWTTAVYERPETFPTNEEIEAGGSDYVIPLTCAEDLAWFTSYVNGFNGCDRHNDAKAKLCADVDMSDYIWVPIGYMTDPGHFGGYFDGQCYSIDGIHIANREEADHVEAFADDYIFLVDGMFYEGLFGYVHGSTSQNAIIKNTFVTSGELYSWRAGSYVGSVAGSVNETTLEFCEGAATINATDGVSVGSVAGSLIHDSYVKGGMGMSTISSGATNTGGVVGALSDVSLNTELSYVEHSIANSNITAATGESYKRGAVVGHFFGSGFADPVYVHPDATGATNMMGDRPVAALLVSSVDKTARGYAYNSAMKYQLLTVTTGNIQIDTKANYTAVTPVTYTNRETGNEVTIESTTKALCEELNSRSTFVDGSTLANLGLHWDRVYGITAINGDYPILYPKNKVNGRIMAVAQRTGEKALRYGSVDDLITQCNKNNVGGTIYMYQSDTIRVATNDNVVVYVHDTVALYQTASKVNAVVGIVMDNSKGNGAEFRDWHMFSASISGGKTGINYGVHQSTYTQFSTALMTFGTEGNWDYNLKQGDEAVYFPDGITTEISDPGKQFDIYSFFEPQYHWINLKRASGNHWHEDEPHNNIVYNNEETYTPGKGYMMAIGNDDNYDNTLLQAKGVLNSGHVTVPVTAEGEHLTGYNLIGNPYQSYLDFNKFANANKNLWTDSESIGYKSYLIYNADKGGFVEYLIDNEGVSFSQGASQDGDRYINMHQGFFVVKNGTATEAVFENTMRVTNQTPHFRDEMPAYPLVNLFCTDSEGKQEISVIELDRPSMAGSLKMKGMLNAKGNMYIHWNDEDFGSIFIDHTPDYVPVWFEAAEDGVFTMTWNTANANFGYMHLIDNIAGADIDMLETDSYTFESHVTDMKARFRLVFKPLGIEEETTEQGDNFAFINGEELVVNGTGELSFIDLNGRVLATQYMAGEQNFMALPNVAEGMYLLRLAGTNGVKVQKIIIRK